MLFLSPLTRCKEPHLVHSRQRSPARTVVVHGHARSFKLYRPPTSHVTNRLCWALLRCLILAQCSYRASAASRKCTTSGLQVTVVHFMHVCVCIFFFCLVSEVELELFHIIFSVFALLTRGSASLFHFPSPLPLSPAPAVSPLSSASDVPLTFVSASSTDHLTQVCQCVVARVSEQRDLTPCIVVTATHVVIDAT